VPLQLAIVGRPNVGKSTLLNTLLQEERVLVGPEAGLTRDSIRAHFECQGRTIYLVNIIFPQFPLFNYMMFFIYSTDLSKNYMMFYYIFYSLIWFFLFYLLFTHSILL
jgi:GTP-binding protein EngB required for normal cell division